MAKMSRREAESILGLTGTYTKQAARTAYRKLSMSYHPDRAATSGIDSDSATVKMQDINEAYQRIMRAFNSNGTDKLTAEDAAYEERRAAEEAKRAAEEEEARERDERAREAWEARRPPFDPRPPEERARARAKWHRDLNDRVYNDPDSPYYRPPAEQPASTAGEEEPVSEFYDQVVSDFPEPKAPFGIRAAKVIATIFPYRLALFFGVIFAMNAVVGIDLFGGPMGLAPNRDADVLVVFAFTGLFFASLANLIFPFMTGPIRRGILNAIENAEENAKDWTC